MTQFASIRKLPAPELHAWALDFPAAGAAARVSERGLYLQGWALGQGDAACSGLVVRTRSEQGEQSREFSFNNGRPDVIHRVLGAQPAGHPHLRCGFMLHLDPVPASFALGVRVDGKTCWVCEVAFGDTPAPRAEPAAAQVIQGTDGWLYLDNDTNHSVDQYTGRLALDDAALARWTAYLDACAGIAGATGARHAVLIAASKEQVLPEHYPHPKGELTVHDQVLGLCRPEHRVLDTAGFLGQRADRGTCFIRTDTHWTDRGAMLVTLELLERLRLDVGVARERFAADVYYTMPFAGDLGVKLFPPVTAATEFLQAPPAAVGAAFDNRLPNIGRVLVHDNPDPAWSGTLLIFGASSSYPMLRYLKRLFGRIVFVHSAGNVDARIVQHERPVYLVMQTTARFMIQAPDTGFDLAGAIKKKLKEADPEVLGKTPQPGRDAFDDARNLPYSQMLDLHHEHDI